MNSLQVIVVKNIFNGTQVVPEETRLDQFKDETVSLTQTIQNVKDLGSIFTDFSKGFTLPATKINNSVFEHYYKLDIR